MSILITGGAGFVGSHIAVELLKSPYDVIIADNYNNSTPSVINRIKKITGKNVTSYWVDVSDRDSLNRIFLSHRIDAVIHCAGYKSIGESVKKPLMYYNNNIGTTLALLEIMALHETNQFIFSSSATVYNQNGRVPYTEDSPRGSCTNPYSRSKYFIEEILKDAASANPKLSMVLLRYFNPIGAHKSGMIGEAPKGIPNNLLPYITQTAAGIRSRLNVFGNDYPTADGTGIRDYVHIEDLAKGHIAALEYASWNTGIEAFNLGTGIGYSVMEIVKAFETATGIHVPCETAPRREGDIPEYYADTTKASKILGWEAKKSVEEMCADAWRWQKWYMEHC